MSKKIIIIVIIVIIIIIIIILLLYIPLPLTIREDVSRKKITHKHISKKMNTSLKNLKNLDEPKVETAAIIHFNPMHNILNSF